MEGACHTKEELAAIIYKPLQEKEASKAIAAQYAAHLVCTGRYGTGDDLFMALPPYLQAALSHLTIAPTAKPTATGKHGSDSATVPEVATSVSCSKLPPVHAAYPSTPPAIPTGAATQVPVVASDQTTSQAATAPVAPVVPPSASPGGTQGNGP